MVLSGFMLLSSKTLPALGAVLEIPFPLASAVRAGPSAESLTLLPASAVLVIGRPAVPTTQERFSLFDRKKRNEEQAEVLVCSFEIKGGAAAIRALPLRPVQNFCPRPDAADKEEKHLQKPGKNITLRLNLSQPGGTRCRRL